MKNKKLSVYAETARILMMLDRSRQSDSSSTRALLAQIRNSISHNVQSTEALAYVFQNLPEDFLGEKKELNDYEQAILTAIQMYALHQQSNMNSVLKLDYKEGERRQNLGDALRSLRSEEDKSIDARFNALVTSSSFMQMQNHLRHLIKILKAKTNTQVDYASLADDLFWYLRGQKDGLKIKWARSYYQLKVNK